MCEETKKRYNHQNYDGHDGCECKHTTIGQIIICNQRRRNCAKMRKRKYELVTRSTTNTHKHTHSPTSIAVTAHFFDDDFFSCLFRFVVAIKLQSFFFCCVRNSSQGFIHCFCSLFAFGLRSMPPFEFSLAPDQPIRRTYCDFPYKKLDRWIDDRVRLHWRQFQIVFLFVSNGWVCRHSVVIRKSPYFFCVGYCFISTRVIKKNNLLPWISEICTYFQNFENKSPAIINNWPNGDCKWTTENVLQLHYLYSLDVQ